MQGFSLPFIKLSTDSKNFGSLFSFFITWSHLNNITCFTRTDWPLFRSFRLWPFSIMFHSHKGIKISDLPQLHAAAPLHLHRPFTVGICWVTLQGYVTLSPLNDASTRYPQESCDYFHLGSSHSHQMCVYHSGTEHFLQSNAGPVMWHAV